MLFDPFLDGFEVRQHQFSGDRFDVADGIDGARDVMNIGIFEAADDLHDGVDFADVREKFIPEAFARGRAFDEAGDVHKLDCRRE